MCLYKTQEYRQLTGFKFIYVLNCSHTDSLQKREEKHKLSKMSLTDQTAQPSPQLLLVGEKDSKRLLEVFVKRSLSLNDGAQHPHHRKHQKHKWITLDERNKRDRKHSSDTSIHLNTLNSEEDLDKYEAFSEPETERKLKPTVEQPQNKSKQKNKKVTLGRNDGSTASQKSDGKPKKWLLHFDKEKRDGKQPNKALKQESNDFRDEVLPHPPVTDELESSTEAKRPKESKKSKKSSMWKSVLGWFSRGNSEKQEDKEKEVARAEEVIPPEEPSSPPISCLPFPDVLPSGDAIIQRRRASKRRKLSLKRRSRDMGLDKATGRPCTLDLSTADHETSVKSIAEVEPTNSYYEKMSEELEKIVHEIKNSPIEENRTFLDQSLNGSSMSKEEVIKRIVALIKQEGDIIDVKLKENPTITSYFNMLSYGSFQQLADQYVQSELPRQEAQPLVAAPELVKFAFTLDFTARVASLSRHAPGHIVGFGNQYLKDRFTHKSESHPHNSDITTTEKQKQEEIHSEKEGVRSHNTEEN
ncbi:uncharacterized protein LOC103030054 [Astyanax mexicanus]|uniref:uncharacterized protein LOC103030054 n=1 Tax=Astyanax mexicanus TaxID=7994 RepID=UPI0020CACAD9|nr:uncharacterized protein LOC103030054 [Astyanax mexicanus]